MTTIFAEQLMKAIYDVLAGATGGLNRLEYSEAVGTATAAASFDIAVAVPAGARIIGANLRVDTALTSGDGGASWDADYVDASGLHQAIARMLAFTKNTKHQQFYDPSIDSPITPLATNVRVRCVGGTFSAGGKVTAVVYYQTITALGDAA